MNLITKTILLVDDEDDIREDLALFLEFSDYKVFQASNGKEAYQCYLDNNLDLIITDIEMPRLNGLELVEAIREKDKMIPIMIISGYSDKDKLLRAIKLNLVEYMIKPFTRKGMLTTINNLFNTQMKEKKRLSEEIFTINNYYFNFTSHFFTYNEVKYTLTKKQSQVLMLFVKNPDVIFEPVDIYYYLHPDYNQEYSNASIRNIIKRLRTLLPEGVIESIYSKGYRFNIYNL
jgi:DNA-binding response OmpR family regulator